MFKYETIADDIQSKILSGFYKPDEKLPQEFELCKQYDASRTTVREAMQLLVYKGFITKQRGSGTYVKAVSGGSAIQNSFAMSQQFGGFSKDKEGSVVTSDVHEFQLVPASKEIAPACGWLLCMLHLPHQAGGWKTSCGGVYLHAYCLYYGNHR